MKAKPLSAATVALVALLLIAASAPAADPPREKRELLAEHNTVAKFTGIAYQQCRGLTAQCPDDCGNSGDFVSFEIVAYLAYSKPGQYGDPKAQTFTFQLQDNHKNLKVSKELSDTIKGLKKGDYVLLNWRHDYVTTFEPGGQSASSPQRPVVKLEKISREEADKLIEQAANPSTHPASASQPAKEPTTRPAQT